MKAHEEELPSASGVCVEECGLGGEFDVAACPPDGRPLRDW